MEIKKLEEEKYILELEKIRGELEKEKEGLLGSIINIMERHNVKIRQYWKPIIFIEDRFDKKLVKENKEKTVYLLERRNGKLSQEIAGLKNDIDVILTEEYDKGREDYEKSVHFRQKCTNLEADNKQLTKELARCEKRANDAVEALERNW